MRTETFADGVTLYLGDCRELLPSMARPAAIISDPPYGQNRKASILTSPDRKRGSHRLLGGAVKDRIWHSSIAGDDKPFDPSHLVGAADIVLLWGAHRFSDRLPGGSWLVWDKRPSGKVCDQGDGEAAWLNGPPRPMRIFRLLWDGVCIGAGAPEVGKKRLHPAQKPETLMSWCVGQARVPAGGIILDPYMGSGSTGIAAVKAGYPFVGMEVDPLFFETAVRRLSAEVKRRRDVPHAS